MAVDYFLELDGIEGESADKAHAKEIEVLAFSWGVANGGSPGPGSGGGAGKPLFEDLLVVARTSKASPRLVLACASGQHVKSAVLTCRRAGAAPVEFLTITLDDVVVASFEIDGGEEEPPTDQIALAFAKARIAYTPVSKTGKPKPDVEIAWDLAKNAKA